MSCTPVRSDLDVSLGLLEEGVGGLLAAELDRLSPEEELRLVARLETLRRRLDAGTDRAAGHLDRSAAFSLDGHRSAKGALKAIGRLPGAEAHGRVRTARVLRELPLVEAAYVHGDIPVAHVRAISRVASNPRVAQHLPGADAIFAHQAAVLSHDDFLAVLRQWEALADADGADQGADECHERRSGGMVESGINGSWSLEATFGSLQGTAMAQVFDQFERAELFADWAEARQRLGDAALVGDLARTRAQRGADALYAIFMRAASSPADGRAPEPVVNIVVDQQTFVEELRRSAGEDVAVDPNESLDGRRCHSVDGTPLRPAEVLAAALVGHVRRVVLDGRGTVIDLGTRRRLFTGSARDAALLQALLRGPGGLRCLWPGCDAHGGCLQVDHRQPAARGGPTEPGNSDAYCGFHNRTKERGYRPERGPDGRWVIHRPDQGGTLTPPV